MDQSDRFTMEKELYQAVSSRDIGEVRTILQTYPKLDINYRNGGKPALYIAAGQDLVDITELLLCHPHIDVNVEGRFYTAFMEACYWQAESTVKLLLKEPSIRANKHTGNQVIALESLVNDGCLKLVQKLIVSGKELELESETVTEAEPEPETGAAAEKRTLDVLIDQLSSRTEYSSKKEKKRVKTMKLLLSSFRDASEATRHQLRLKTGWYDETAANLFSLVVFLCDDFLGIKNSVTIPTQTARYFTIMLFLPMELQMKICYLIVSDSKLNSKANITALAAEVAFRALVRWLHNTAFFASVLNSSD